MLDTYVNWQQQLAAREEVSKKTVWEEYNSYYKKNYVKDGRVYINFRRNKLKEVDSTIIKFNPDAFKGVKKYRIDWLGMRQDQEFKRLLTYVLSTAYSQKEWAYVTMTHVLDIKKHIDSILTHH